MSYPELNNLITESGVKNLAQVYTILKYTRESHIEFSKSLNQYLKENGFLNHDL